MDIESWINWLSTIPNTYELKGLKEPHSYRGYYDQLALEPSNKLMKPSELVELLKSTIGQTFEGYKGGNFKMATYTEVYLAEWGCTGEKLTKSYFYPYDIGLVFQFFEESPTNKRQFQAWLKLRGREFR